VPDYNIEQAAGREALDVNAIDEQWQAYRDGHAHFGDWRCCEGCKMADQQVPALLAEVEQLRDELRIFRESEALEVVVAEAERDRLGAVLARAKSLGGLIRWCGWPGCLDFYAAHPGPAEQGWTRSKALDVLRCPKHSAAGHQVTWQAADDDGRPLTDIPITCECGESEVVKDATLGALSAWWERHILALGLAGGAA
jgi:hypothetical protein